MKIFEGIRQEQMSRRSLMLVCKDFSAMNLQSHSFDRVTGIATPGIHPSTSHLPAGVPSAKSLSIAASSPPAANWHKVMFAKEGAGLAALSLLVAISVGIVQTLNLRIQQENKRRQRSLEAFKAIFDFNESYAKIVDTIPQGSRIVLDDRKANFLLEKLPVEGSSGNSGNKITKSPFTSHESFFRRYWMLQMAQFQSKEEKFLPEETYRIWIRSNKIVYENGTYWTSADAYVKGYDECRGLFLGLNDSTPDVKVGTFIAFMDNYFGHPTDKSVSSQLNGVALDMKSIDLAKEDVKVVSDHLDKDIL